jgi:osmotically inducible lipoprotein OsmB
MRATRTLRPIALVALLGLGACAGLSPTEQRVMTGTGAGAAGGAIIGAIAGNAGVGALIGAGAGAVGGYLWDQSVQSRDRAFSQGYAAGRASRPPSSSN